MTDKQPDPPLWAKIALPVGGGVEEAAEAVMAFCRPNNWDEIDPEYPEETTASASAWLALEAALSPRSADGQEWLAAKAGAAAPAASTRRRFRGFCFRGGGMSVFHRCGHCGALTFVWRL